MNPAYQKWLQHRLEQQQKSGLWREQQTLSSAQAPQVERKGQLLDNFSSNDYLSLANHPEVIDALCQGGKRFGVGSGASHLISGHSEAHEMLQQTLSQWLGFPSITLFSSGYMANAAMLGALLEKPDLIVQDKLNHASLMDAAQHHSATHKRFLHANAGSLSQQLSGDFRFKAVVTDGVFSMDGDIAPLPEYLDLTDHHNALLMVDDAHGIGVLGSSGQGSLAHFNLSPHRITAYMGTLGKALGTSGAFIASDQQVGETLTQFARNYIFTTAMSPAMAMATIKSVQIIRTDHARRDRLLQNIVIFRQMAEQFGVPLMPSQTAIQPVILGSERHCLRCAEYLRCDGFWVGAIRPPTVAKETARLRITINSDHSTDTIERLVQSLAKSMLKHCPERLNTTGSLS